jgi:hypothetical protein
VVQQIPALVIPESTRTSVFTFIQPREIAACAERQKADFFALQTANGFGEAPTVTAAD